MKKNRRSLTDQQDGQEQNAPNRGVGTLLDGLSNRPSGPLLALGQPCTLLLNPQSIKSAQFPEQLIEACSFSLMIQNIPRLTLAEFTPLIHCDSSC